MYNLGYLCHKWNSLTAPYIPLFDYQHKARAKLARKIMRLIRKHPDYCMVHELSNSSLSCGSYTGIKLDNF